MILAIPAANGRLIPHFGHARSFAFIKLNLESGNSEPPVYKTPPPHTPGALPRWIREQDAEVVVCGGMGKKAQMLCQADGIAVYTGVAEAPLDEIIDAYIKGTLEAGNDACHHHEHHQGC